jgi:predicted transcriptional regulator
MKTPRPTDAELMVLRILWQEGPSTVRHVHELLRQEKELGYTTVLKTLQVMTEKGIVVRDVSTRSHVYSPAATEVQTQRTLVDHLMSLAFGGSALKLVMQALSARPASKEELDQIRKLIDKEKGAGK